MIVKAEENELAETTLTMHEDMEQALKSVGMDPADFAGHLRDTALLEHLECVGDEASDDSCWIKAMATLTCRTR